MTQVANVCIYKNQDSAVYFLYWFANKSLNSLTEVWLLAHTKPREPRIYVQTPLGTTSQKMVQYWETRCKQVEIKSRFFIWKFSLAGIVSSTCSDWGCDLSAGADLHFGAPPGWPAGISGWEGGSGDVEGGVGGCFLA